MADDGKPTFDELRDAMMPPGTDREALWAALKGAHRTGGYVPGQPAPDISFGGGGGGTPGWTPFPPAVGSAPADPFTKGSEAAAGLAEMYEDLLASGIPLASVERILGAMLATYGMTKDEP
jgi:hypothetical protein